MGCSNSAAAKPAAQLAAAPAAAKAGAPKAEATPTLLTPETMPEAKEAATAATSAAPYPTDKAPNLLSPVKLGEIELKNRVVMAPLTRGRSGATRVPNERMVTYYTQRAENTGLIIAEATCVNLQAEGWVDSPSMYTPEHMAGWRKVVDAVHSKGCPMVLQLWHQGRAAHSSFMGGEQIVSASATKINGETYAADGSKVEREEARALKLEEIPALIECYKKAAEFAKEAGFDGVEVHSANGYLLDQFLQSSTNKREDQYGGAKENRLRLLSEILDAIFKVYPPSRVAVRLSPNGNFNDMGSEDNIETFTYALEELSKKGLGYMHVMDGLGFGSHEKCEAFTIEAMRKCYPGKLMCNVGYTRDSAEKVISKGHADCVAFGRPFIANPDLVLRFATDAPLAEADANTWFSHDDDGYHTYPTMAEAGEAAAKPPAPAKEDQVVYELQEAPAAVSAAPSPEIETKAAAPPSGSFFACCSV